MATREELEMVKGIALYEQMSAAYDQRRPDRDLLDSLAFSVLHELAPVACVTEDAQYLAFHPDNGHYTEPVDPSIPISGRFGGFKILQESVSAEGVDDVPFMRLHYLIADTSYLDNGYLCPVDTTKLYDVTHELEEDEHFEELHDLIWADPLDIRQLYDFIHNCDPSTHDMALYTAYIRAAMTPHDVFKRISAEGYFFSGEDKKQPIEFIAEEFATDINRYDVFTVAKFVGDAQELVIRRGNTPSLYIPLGLVTDVELAGEEQ